MEVRRFTHVGGWPLIALLQGVQHVRPAVAAAGSAYFPKIMYRHSLEIGSRRAQLRAMEYRFAARQLVENANECGIGNELGFRPRPHPTIICVRDADWLRGRCLG